MPSCSLALRHVRHGDILAMHIIGNRLPAKLAEHGSKQLAQLVECAGVTQRRLAATAVQRTGEGFDCRKCCTGVCSPRGLQRVDWRRSAAAAPVDCGALTLAGQRLCHGCLRGCGGAHHCS